MLLTQQFTLTIALSFPLWKSRMLKSHFKVLMMSLHLWSSWYMAQYTSILWNFIFSSATQDLLLLLLLLSLLIFKLKYCSVIEWLKKANLCLFLLEEANSPQFTDWFTKKCCLYLGPVDQVCSLSHQMLRQEDGKFKTCQHYRVSSS